MLVFKLCSHQQAKAQNRSGGMETLQMSKQTMLHEKVTPSQGNTAQEQNNTNIRTDPEGFFDWFSYRTRSALCKGHC